MNELISPLHPRHTALALACAAALLGGCSTADFFAGDKVDYKSKVTKTAPLEIPPDLTQLARDGRYRPQTGVVSASTINPAAAGASPAGASPAGASPAGATAAGANPAATTGPSAATAPVAMTAAVATVATVAPASVGDMKIERDGTQRWLVVGSMPPEKLWPQLQAFWAALGFTLEVDDPQTGVMETAWAENRAKLPQDWIRSALGKALDSLYSTGERDRFRTRVERTPTGSEVYISHRGMQEVFNSENRELKSTVWVPRPVDPQLEAEFLSRLMIKLGAPEGAARTTVANAEQQPPLARAVVPAAFAASAGASPVAANAAPGATSLELDDGFDRAWRRVGLALDRTGFTVEDRDRAAGLYFVRYVDPANAGKEDPGFFEKIFGADKKPVAPIRYRVLVKATPPKSTVSVLDSSGAPDTSDNARRIIGLLLNELK